MLIESQQTLAEDPEVQKAAGYIKTVFQNRAKHGGDPAIDEDTVFVAVQLLDQIAYRESLLRLIYRGEITGWINEDGEPAFRATA